MNMNNMNNMTNRMKKKVLTVMLCALPMMAAAQSFDFDMTKPQPIYSDENGAGYDLLSAPDKKHPAEPFYFSVRVPDGNYRVSVVLGSKKRAGETTVRAEGRRLMVENVITKKGKTTTCEFTVNKRTPQIDEKNRVRIKDREKDYLTWDDKLTLEFNGQMPTVQSIHIERADDVPTIYLCGNSTVVDQSYEPWASWGQMITRWFDSGVCISNHAESGLTARTFLASGRLDKILTTLKAGDIVIAEFGHNDEKEKRAGDGAWYSYSRNLKIFADRVREKGGTIIFVTPTARRLFKPDHQTLDYTHGEYPEAMRTVAKREGVELIELNGMTRTFYEALGEEGSKKALVHYPANTFPNQSKALADNTHFNPYGAWEVAKMIVMGLKQLNSPLVVHLRPDWQDFDPAHPDDPQTFVWYMSGTGNILKPDGN